MQVGSLHNCGGWLFSITAVDFAFQLQSISSRKDNKYGGERRWDGVYAISDEIYDSEKPY